MTSPVPLRHLREIWVFGPNGYREVVGECGTLHADRADALAAALRRWLRLDVFDRDALPDDLLQFPSFLKCLGVDPRRCRVRALPVADDLNAVRESEAAFA